MKLCSAKTPAFCWSLLLQCGMASCAVVMKSYTSNWGRKLISELRMLPDFPFETRCGLILQTVFPAMIQTPARSELDRSGIDHCMLLEGSDDGFLHVFQCKGFSVEEFSASQLQQSLEAIAAFACSRFKTKHYAIVINRIVKGEARRKIEEGLHKLVQNGKVEIACLLNLEAFIEMVFQEAQKQLMALLNSSVEEFQAQHRQRMEEGQYVENVPFLADGNSTPHFNPLRFVEQRVLQLAEKPTNKRGWIFLSGEFGFGKTSLGLHLAGVLQAQGITCLYLPVAQFHASAFEMERMFLWEALRVILQEEVDQTDERNMVLHAALKEIFKREKRILLIFDGIDEHPICWRETGLMNVFGIFKTFNVNCLFSLREEFLAERTGHFQAAIKGGPGSFMLRLNEWSDPLIIEYTKAYLNSIAETEVQQRIGHFEEAVRSGRYIDYYGDIPKRPLFLKMLLDDISEDDLKIRNLSDLYTIYITQKFERDRASSTTKPVVSRPLNMNEDYTVVCAQLFKLMTMAAGRMYTIEEGEVRLEPKLSEETLRECAGKISNTPLDLPSILLNSVMVPVGQRNALHRGGTIEVAFAHTSFQEFFLAHHILSTLLESTCDQAILQHSLPKPVARFLQGLIANLPPDRKATVIAHLRSAPIIHGM
jgi:hypothetical protein